MTQDILTQTSLWFEKAVATPNSKNFHTQLGVHMEEVNEMLMEVTAVDFETSILVDTARAALHALSVHLKTHDNVIGVEPGNRQNYLDAICDQIVTGVGCAHMAGMDVLGGMTEVNRSNFSKFNEAGEPIFDPNMKVMKGEFYSKADLSPFV